MTETERVQAFIQDRVFKLERKKKEIMEKYPESDFGLKGVFKAEKVDDQINELLKLNQQFVTIEDQKYQIKQLKNEIQRSVRDVEFARDEFHACLETKSESRMQRVAERMSNALAGRFVMVPEEEMNND